MPATATTPPRSAASAPSAAKARALTVAAGVVAATAVWIVADPLAGVALDVKSGSKTQHVALPVAIFVSLLAGLAAWGVTTLLSRRSSGNPRTTWLIAGSIVLLVSLTGPLGSGIGTATKVSLVCEHLAVAAVLIPGMARTMAPRR
jgi:hypothetical protein